MIMLSTTVAHAETVRIAFPSGWVVTEMAPPLLDGKPVLGNRRRAVLSAASGKPMAAIELTILPQTSDRSHQLTAVMQQTQQTAISVYRKASLDDICDTPASLRVAGKDGLRTACAIRRGEKLLLRQEFVVWITANDLLSLSYSAPIGPFAVNARLFEQTLGSVRLE